MSKSDKHVAPEPVIPTATPCVVCGLNTGEFVTVVGHIRAHEECAARCPDVIAKVKARA